MSLRDIFSNRAVNAVLLGIGLATGTLSAAEAQTAPRTVILSQDRQDALDSIKSWDAAAFSIPNKTILKAMAERLGQKAAWEKFDKKLDEEPGPTQVKYQHPQLYVLAHRQEALKTLLNDIRIGNSDAASDPELKSWARQLKGINKKLEFMTAPMIGGWNSPTLTNQTLTSPKKEALDRLKEFHGSMTSPTGKEQMEKLAKDLGASEAYVNLERRLGYKLERVGNRQFFDMQHARIHADQVAFTAFVDELGKKAGAANNPQFKTLQTGVLAARDILYFIDKGEIRPTPKQQLTTAAQPQPAKTTATAGTPPASQTVQVAPPSTPIIKDAIGIFSFRGQALIAKIGAEITLLTNNPAFSKNGDAASLKAITALGKMIEKQPQVSVSSIQWIDAARPDIQEAARNAQDTLAAFEAAVGSEKFAIVVKNAGRAVDADGPLLVDQMMRRGSLAVPPRPRIRSTSQPQTAAPAATRAPTPLGNRGGPSMAQ